MPWGLIALAAGSWLVYRHARGAGRAAAGWVLVLWVSLFAGAAVGGAGGVVLQRAGLGADAVPVGGVCGIVAAVAVVLWSAGRSLPAASRATGAEARRPAAVPPVGSTGDGLCPHCRARLPGVWDAFCPECCEPLW